MGSLPKNDALFKKETRFGQCQTGFLPANVIILLMIQTAHLKALQSHLLEFVGMLI